MYVKERTGKLIFSVVCVCEQGGGRWAEGSGITYSVTGPLTFPISFISVSFFRVTGPFTFRISFISVSSCLSLARLHFLFQSFLYLLSCH